MGTEPRCDAVTMFAHPPKTSCAGAVAPVTHEDNAIVPDGLRLMFCEVHRRRVVATISGPNVFEGAAMTKNPPADGVRFTMAVVPARRGEQGRRPAKRCCDADCHREGPDCGGNVVAYDEIPMGDDYVWAHACEKHIEEEGL